MGGMRCAGWSAAVAVAVLSACVAVSARSHTAGLLHAATLEEASETAGGAAGAAAGPETIPARIMMTYKFDLRSPPADKEMSVPLKNLAANMQKTLEKHKDMDFTFLDDKGCVDAIRAAGIETTALESGFLSEKDGSYKADICRGAHLYTHGGYYFDIDLDVHEDVRSFLPKQTTFTTVQSVSDGDGMFQAFIGVSPQNNIMKEYLTTMAHHYDGSQKISGLMGTKAMEGAVAAVTKRSKAEFDAPSEGIYILREKFQNQLSKGNDLERHMATSRIDDLTQQSASASAMGKTEGCCCGAVVLDEHADSAENAHIPFHSRALDVSPHCYHTTIEMKNTAHLKNLEESTVASAEMEEAMASRIAEWGQFYRKDRTEAWWF